MKYIQLEGKFAKQARSLWGRSGMMDHSLNVFIRISADPASDYDGRMVKAAPPVNHRILHKAGDTSLIEAGMGSNPTCNQIFFDYV